MCVRVCQGGTILGGTPAWVCGVSVHRTNSYSESGSKAAGNLAPRHGENPPVGELRGRYPCASISRPCLHQVRLRFSARVGACVCACVGVPRASTLPLGATGLWAKGAVGGVHCHWVAIALRSIN